MKEKSNAPNTYNQLKYSFTGFIIYTFSSSDFIVNYGLEFYPLGFIPVILSLSIFTYTIIRYRFLDINLAITRAGIFVVVYTLVLGLPFWLGSITKSWFPATSLAVLLATLGPFIYTSLRRQAEAKLRAEDIKKYNTLKRFTATLGRVRDIGLDRLLKLIVYRLVKTLRVSYGAIYLYDEELKTCSLRASHCLGGHKCTFPQGLLEESDLIKFIIRWHRDFLLEDVQRLAAEPTKPNNKNHPRYLPELNDINLFNAASQMKESGVQLVIPSFLERELIGFLLLGQKLSQRHYNPEDIEVLSVLSRSAALAIMNAIFMIELKKAEGELAEASRIAQIGYLASATGHQLSNVLNNIVAAGYNVLDDDSVINCLNSSPEAKQCFEKVLNSILTNARDGGMIIDELRDYAKAEKEKNFSPLSLKEVLDKTLNVLYIPAHKFQAIDIKINIPHDTPLVLGSFVGLQNVFVNLFNNAYDAILEKKEFLKIHPQPHSSNYKGSISVDILRSKGDIHIHIKDDGKGIPQDVQKRLFTPLYTTKGSQEKREEKKTTGGTGIGLYTILVIVKNHGGSIKLERTEPLKGTDFLITLPVPKEEEIRKAGENKGGN